MESKNAAFLRQGLVDRYRKMTPGERVKAFIEHSRLMQQLRKAGEIRRADIEKPMGSIPMVTKTLGSESIDTNPIGIKGELGSGGKNG